MRIGKSAIKWTPAAVCWLCAPAHRRLGHFEFALVLLKWRSGTGLGICPKDVKANSREDTQRPETAAKIAGPSEVRIFRGFPVSKQKPGPAQLLCRCPFENVS
jgi:hypothetical protein